MLREPRAEDGSRRPVPPAAPAGARAVGGEPNAARASMTPRVAWPILRTTRNLLRATFERTPQSSVAWAVTT
jgi:hypothetical protein